MSWTTIPDFADGAIVRAETFQDLWDNLYFLKNPNYSETAQPGDNTTWKTTSSAFSDIDSTYYRNEFESYGNDLLVAVPLEYRFQNLSNGATAFRLELDGSAIGNTNGLGRIMNYSTQIDEVHYLYHVIENVNAGEHTLDVQYATITAGTAQINGRGQNRLWIQEF
jgi:hypothetical protein